MSILPLRETQEAFDCCTCRPQICEVCPLREFELDESNIRFAARMHDCKVDLTQSVAYWLSQAKEGDQT